MIQKSKMNSEGGEGSGLPGRGRVSCTNLERARHVSKASAHGMLQRVCKDE